MYSEQLAGIYELIYRSRGKDWAAEAEHVTSLIRGRSDRAESLLDVACGTGAHLETFRSWFEHVEGLEIAEPMRRRAATRLPGVPVHAGDMRNFDLGRTFDVVCCLFVAISYVDSLQEMRAAVQCMARHLDPGGVLVIEPWWFPENFIDGYVAGDLAVENGRTVARVSHSTRQGDATRMEVRFLLGEAGGIREFAETDVMRLFTEQEYRAAFEAAGCAVEYLPDGLTGRGLFVGIRDEDAVAAVRTADD